MKNIDKRKQIASDWFKKLQISICSELESIEKKYGKKREISRTKEDIKS